MWEPKYRSVFYRPSIAAYEDGFDTGCYLPECGWHAPLVTRGLAFEHQADAAEVGSYLAVIGKLCNLAKQLNKDAGWGNHFFVIRQIGPGLNIDNWSFVNGKAIYDGDRPRFHSREAAEIALAALTSEERATLVRGVS